MKQQQTLLIVDDEPAVCAMLAAMLKRLGFRTLQAYSGRQALEMYSGNPDDIDLVIADVVMPVMNGPTLARRLQDVCPRVKVLFMSGYMEKALWECDRVRVKEVPFVQKPFTREALSRAIHDLLLEADVFTKTFRTAGMPPV